MSLKPKEIAARVVEEAQVNMSKKKQKNPLKNQKQIYVQIITQLKTQMEIPVKHSIIIHHQKIVDYMIPMSLKQNESAASAVEEVQAYTRKKTIKNMKKTNKNMKRKMIIMINALMMTPLQIPKVIHAITTIFSLPPVDSMTLKISRPPMLAVHVAVDLQVEILQTTKEEIDHQCYMNQEELQPYWLMCSLTEFPNLKKLEKT